MKRFLTLFGTLALVLVLTACGLGDQAALRSIAATASERGDLDTVLSILPDDLASALGDDAAGPFTLFAPTDAAFAAIADALGGLSADEVREVLLLHVLDGRVSSGAAASAGSTRSLGGELLYFDAAGPTLIVDGAASVSVTDIQASNGVIHVIDAVLLPKGTIADAVVAAASADEPEFTTLLTAVLAADEAVLATLGDVEAGPLTVFAPTDAAFAALPTGALDDLLADPAALTAVLLYHVTGAGALRAGDVLALTADGPIAVTMLSGDDATVSESAGSVFVDAAQAVVTDLLTANGVIHVIDAVLQPPTE
jgi:transforming growth factor-beta-induced protein